MSIDALSLNDFRERLEANKYKLNDNLVHTMGFNSMNNFQRKIKQNQKLPTNGRPRRASQN